MRLPGVWQVSPDTVFAEATATALLQHLESFAEDSVCIGLSGGKTPAPVYREIARLFPLLIRGNRNWKWFQVDERWVSIDSPQSNQRLIRESLFPNGDLQRWGTFFPVNITDDPVRSAEDYQSVLAKAVIDSDTGTSSVLVMGIGEDGHTASLFPGSEWPLKAPEPVFQAFHVKHLSSWRLSLTPPAILLSRQLWFLASGEGKQRILRQLTTLDPDVFPAGYLAKRHPSVRFFLDEAASGVLKPGFPSG